VIGFEALVRWQHPEKGLLPPIEFLGIAEETGMIINIGKIVMRKACQELQSWQSRYESARDLTMSINLSCKQLLDPDLESDLKKIIKETGVNSQNLNFEITEETVMEDTEISIKILKDLKQLGINIQMDDFGTGYSSLSTLHRFPIDAIKIDQSFVKRIGKGNSNGFVRMIIKLAKELNLEPIAEGIEQADQLEELKRLGCRFGQGYLFEKPVSSDRAERIVASL
jgi:EAL domain-containing protein (putative c-di-GMP-specific phosphodiesterase class I)